MIKQIIFRVLKKNKIIYASQILNKVEQFISEDNKEYSQVIRYTINLCQQYYNNNAQTYHKVYWCTDELTKIFRQIQVQRLKQFLAQNNLIKKIEQYNKKTIDELIHIYDNLGWFLFDHITWINSNEGHDFWCQHHQKLYKYVNFI